MAPTFSVESGTYESSQTVTITSSTAGATIRYTTNGSQPSALSTLYTGPITISSSCMLNAISMASGYADSDISSAIYSIYFEVKTYTETDYNNAGSPANLVIPSGYTNIGNHAFTDCTGLTSITIPSSVTSIDSSAFENCTGLTSVNIPSSITSTPSMAVPVDEHHHLVKRHHIGRQAFYGCSGYEHDIPSKRHMDWRAGLYGCTGLTSITIPSSVTTRF